MHRGPLLIWWKNENVKIAAQMMKIQLPSLKAKVRKTVITTYQYRFILSEFSKVPVFFSSRTCTKNCEMCKTIVKSSGGIKVKKSKLLYLRCESWKVVKTSLNIRVEYVFPIYKLVTFCCGPFHFPILFQLPFHCYLKYYFGLYKVLFMVNRICLMRLYWG